MAHRMLVVAAHMGDFVWRCGGSIAKYIQDGSEVQVLVLSSGIRGEANDYWKQPGASREQGIARRLSEGKMAAAALGVKHFAFWNLPDYPMPLGVDVVERLSHLLREFRPDFVVTHDSYDAYNPDHDGARQAVRQAYATAFGAGFQDGLQVIPRRMTIFGFEPHNTELCGFKPGMYIDITEQIEAKQAAMKAFSTQPAMYADYMRKAEIRGAEAAGRCGCTNCKYAEAFSLGGPIGSTGRFVW